MTRTFELLFIDPAVSHIDTLVGHLRPGVEPIMLKPEGSAARQISAALRGRRGLAAVHVIAHGAPGRVSFAAGDWSSETLAKEAEALKSIGRALAVDGELRLWSCETAAGEAGDAFIARLAQATGADVVAARGLVGDAALGGSWELTAAARPPLTPAGVAGYAGVLSTDSW